MRCLCRHHRSRAGSPAKPRLQPEALRMNNFEYVRPATISDAVTAATRPGAAYLASGTNLLDLMKGGIACPSRLVDITRLPGLDRVERLVDGGLRQRAKHLKINVVRPTLGKRRMSALGRC